VKLEAAGTGRLPFPFATGATGSWIPRTSVSPSIKVYQTSGTDSIHPRTYVKAFAGYWGQGVACSLTFSRPRRDNRSANGTVTLRRSSTTPHGTQVPQSTQPEAAMPLPTSETPFGQQQQHHQQQHHNTSEPAAGGRYSKNSLLDIYRSQPDHTNGSVSRLFVNSWDPGHSNGSNGRGWGKSTDSRDNHGPEICWDSSGQVQPIGLEEMSALEKNVGFTTTFLVQRC
jgi:hypothetical protein